jgi:hypothetical protein
MVVEADSVLAKERKKNNMPLARSFLIAERE